MLRFFYFCFSSAGASLQLVPNPFKSTITPHTLANFQSLPKLIIINHFYSPAGASLQLVPNSPRWRKLAACAQFTIQNSLPRWRKLAACAQFTIQNSIFSSCALPPSLLERGNGGEDFARASLQLVPNSQFKIHPPVPPVSHSMLISKF